MSEYQESLERGRKEWGEKFDTSALDECDPAISTYFHGPRVRVVSTYANGETETRTGTISRTTGWRPVFLLMHRSNAIGSSDVLSPRDKVTAVQRDGREYTPIK